MSKGRLTNRFCYGKRFLHVWGVGRGFTQECFSNFSNDRFFQAEKLLEKTLSARKNIIGNITLSKTGHLNLNKFGVGNYIPDCRSAPFT